MIHTIRAIADSLEKNKEFMLSVLKVLSAVKSENVAKDHVSRVKAFESNFASSLKSLLEAVCEDLKGMKIVLPKSVEMNPFPSDVVKAFRVEEQGYNRAVSDIQAALRKTIEKI